MKLFSIDMTVYATAYIKAETMEDALKKARLMKRLAIEVEEDDFVTGRDYDDPELPDVSLSPAMTVEGPASGWAEVAFDYDEETV